MVDGGTILRKVGSIEIFVTGKEMKAVNLYCSPQKIAVYANGIVSPPQTDNLLTSASRENKNFGQAFTSHAF